MKKQSKPNREIHAIPTTDRKFKHEVSMNCECKPQLTKSKTGTVVVEHVKMGKGRDLWHMEFGINGKKVEVVDFLDGESPKNIDKFLKAIQNALPKFGSD